MHVLSGNNLMENAIVVAIYVHNVWLDSKCIRGKGNKIPDTVLDESLWTSKTLQEPCIADGRS